MADSRRNYGPLTLAELDFGGNEWVAWVRKMSLQKFVAKSALSPDKQLLVSVAGLAKRWGCTQSYVYKLIKEDRLEATVLDDVYGQKIGFGIHYGEVLRYEREAKRKGELKKLEQGITLAPE